VQRGVCSKKIARPVTPPPLAEKPETILNTTPRLDTGFDASAPAGGAALPASMDVIFIEGFRGQTVIGIDDAELHDPQPIEIDLTAGLPRLRACDTDRIGDTIDYALVHERLERLLAGHPLQLLEALAEAIAGFLIDEFGAAWVRVKVRKPRKFENVQAVGVQIERHACPLSGPSHGGATVLKFLASGMVPGKR
jgi:dihydroneopterin aldolase